jgi:hypothetical protein
MMPIIRLEDWRAALEEALGRSNDEGMTSQEISLAMRLSHRTTMERLRILFESGRLGSGKRAKITLDGRQAWCPVYWVRDAEKKPKQGGKT